MPAVSKKQQRFMGAALNRARHGKKRPGDPSAKVADEFATSGPLKDLPMRVRKFPSA